MDIQKIIKEFQPPKGKCFYFDIVLCQLQPEIKQVQKRVFFEEEDFIILAGRNLGESISGGISIREIEIENYKQFVEFLFPECEVIDCQGRKEGHPDFIIKIGDEEIYLEFKSQHDGLRLLQLEWMNQNKDKEVYILFIKNNTSQKGYSRGGFPEDPNSSKFFKGYPFIKNKND